MQYSIWLVDSAISEFVREIVLGKMFNLLEKNAF